MRINRVMTGSNAERIGLKAGDVLLRLNDQSVRVGLDVADALEDDAARIEDHAAGRARQPAGGTERRLSAADRRDAAQAPVRARRHAGPRRPRARRQLVTATTRGVAAFTLLLSPDQFDFGKPVKVVANGRTVFDGKVEKNVRTLLKYAASDNDRTMLFGAELHIKLD